MKHLAFLFLLILPSFMSAQFEAGVMVGISNYAGDLAPKNVWGSLGETQAAYGGFVRYNFSTHIAAKLGVNYGTISADDANAALESQQQRNLSFKSGILEVGLTGEFNILGYQPYNLERVFSPYIFAGIAWYRHNPKTFYEGEWVELQPLGTEGQGLDQYPDRDFYSLSQFSIPFGGGLKYAINDKWNLGLEGGVRYTFTDYLDDVSLSYVERDLLLNAPDRNGALAVALADRAAEPRAAGRGRGASGNDWYLMIGLTVSYNFADNGLVGSRGRGRKGNGCYD